MLYLNLCLIILCFVKTYSFRLLHKENRWYVATIDSFRFIPYLALQQIALWMMWYFVSLHFRSFVLQACVTSIIFSVAHLHTLYRFRKGDALTLILSSFVGGFAFVYLYATFTYGLYVGFLVHIAYHVVLDLVYWKIG
jgi:hypothetical protein